MKNIHLINSCYK